MRIEYRVIYLYFISTKIWMEMQLIESLVVPPPIYNFEFTKNVLSVRTFKGLS